MLIRMDLTGLVTDPGGAFVAAAALDEADAPAHEAWPCYGLKQQQEGKEAFIACQHARGFIRDRARDRKPGLAAERDVGVCRGQVVPGYCFTSGHLDSDSGRNALSPGMTSSTL